MAPQGLRDQDRLDGLSNFAVWKAKILVVMEAYGLREHAEKVLAMTTNADLLKNHEEVVTHAKRFIMDGVKDHVVPHITEKTMAHDMWVALTSLYEGRSVQRRMLLENQMRLFMMAKGEEIEPFLLRLQAIRDQLTAMGVKVEDDVMVRTALNLVTKDWETFFESILGRADLPN